jgi:dienelactone hydrolase
MIVETYSTGPGTDFHIEIAPAPADGKRHPVVVLVHGNYGLTDPFGDQLRNFTEAVAALGYLAALPTYYRDGQGNPNDTNIAAHLSALTAAVTHLSNRSDADPTRLGLVGFSLGGGIAMSFIADSPAGTVKAFADFYGLVPPGLLVPPDLDTKVAKFPPTIIFYNNSDPVVPVASNSEPFIKALAHAGIAHEHYGYDDDWPDGAFHAFRPGGDADKESRARTKTWLTTYMPTP